MAGVISKRFKKKFICHQYLSKIIYVFFGGCYYNAFHLFWDHSGSEFGTPNWAPNAPTTGRPPVKRLQTLATHKVSATVLQS
jgi:hypothetical protein